MKISKMNGLFQITLWMLLIAGVVNIANAQTKYFTREGVIEFSSDAPMEKIEAKNNKVASIIETATGKVNFVVLIKSFHFEKALMQEHFNENYMESDKYPKATFEGKISNPDDIKWDKPGTYKTKVKGNMTIHGVTKEVTGDGNIVIKDGGTMELTSAIKITVADYKIEIPNLVKDNIAKTVDVTISGKYNSTK